MSYARQIARDWNVRDKKSGFAGFVTEFSVASDYLTKYDLHVVGASEHKEYWIPSEELSSFNNAISDRIVVREAFFGAAFAGYVPDSYGLKGKDASAQFVALSKAWDSSTFDVAGEISANRKSVYLNWLFWAQNEFSELGANLKHGDDFLGNLKKVWEFNQIEVPLPSRLSERQERPSSCWGRFTGWLRYEKLAVRN